MIDQQRLGQVPILPAVAYAEETEEVVGFDVAMVDGDGQICYYVRNARFRMINL